MRPATGMARKVTELLTGKGTVDLALIHYPVINKNREIIGSAVTNLDLHDIARAARTYGVNAFYIVTPYRDQQALFTELLDHWLEGYGAEYNARRGEALSLVRIGIQGGCDPFVVHEPSGTITVKGGILATTAGPDRSRQKRRIDGGGCHHGVTRFTNSPADTVKRADQSWEPQNPVLFHPPAVCGTEPVNNGVVEVVRGQGIAEDSVADPLLQ